MTNLIKYINRFKRNISFRAILNGFLHFVDLRKIKQHDILFLCHDNNRPVLLNNKFYSPLIDSINILLEDNYSSITVALPFSKYSGKATYGNTINVNVYILIAILKRFLFYRSRTIKDAEKDPLVSFYFRLINQVKPKVIVGVQPSSELCIAAKNQGVLVFDVQHGIIEFEEDFSYYSSKKRLDINNLGWPNYILCRNEHTYNFILNEITYCKPMMIGNLNKYFFSNIYLDKHESPSFNNDSKKIMFTYQPFYPSLFERENKMGTIVFPKALLNLIYERKHNFIIKLHPSQIQNPKLYRKHIKEFDKLFKDYLNVEYTYCNNRPLEYSLAISDLHITFNSASVFDAADFNLKSILLDDDFIRLDRYFGGLLNSDVVEISPKLNLDLNSNFKKVDQKIDSKDQEYISDFKNFILTNGL